MRFIYDDGGRAAAGYKGAAGDCGIRAVATATGKDYRFVYDRINVIASDERPRNGKKRSSARNGIYPKTLDKLMKELGWTWVPTMGIGTGCKVHLADGELPAGRLVVRVSKHYTAVVDGLIRDTFDPQRETGRCVYGYWHEPR